MKDMRIQEIIENFEDVISITITDEMEEEIFDILNDMSEEQLSDITIREYTRTITDLDGSRYNRKEAIILFDDESIIDSVKFDDGSEFNIYS